MKKMLDHAWSGIAINTCILAGCDHFFVAPGSRCTPLTLAVARHQNACVVQHFDERGLAFAALGYARATGRPGVFICTSGTAVANAFPAVVEAAMDAVPLLLFTADRPPELRATGANQAIDQQKIFGDFARWFFDMPTPTEEISLQFVSSQVNRAMEQAWNGPVHLNWMFREPFTADASLARMEIRHVETLRRESAGGIAPASESPSPEITIGGRTLIALGSSSPDEARLVVEFAKRAGLPLVADVTSGIRGLSPEIATSSLPQPEAIVHIGGRMVSKRWWNYVAQLPMSSTRFLHLDPRARRIDPHHMDFTRVPGAIEAVLPRVHVQSPADGFREAWEVADRARAEAIRGVLDSVSELNEPSIAFTLASEIPDGDGLVLGNSSPIRDMDWFGMGNPNAEIRVAANRGASGIDGLVSTAVGFARGLKQTTTLVLGDLSCLHDLNALAMVSESETPLIVIVINNQGGGIFDLLPIATQTPHFEQYFATPHALGFYNVAATFGLPYSQPNDNAAFADAYRKSLAEGQSQLIELNVDRQANLDVRCALDREINS